MSEKEKETLQEIIEVIPKLSDFQKGRLYGLAERIREENEEAAKRRRRSNEQVKK
ncbi:MAG: hypothetical protein LUE96_07425 [Lachnospiraceae bacterium]|nr:hypothetical protein [Lachnospiraceae bacterium]